MTCAKSSKSGRSVHKQAGSAVYTDQREHARVGMRVVRVRKETHCRLTLKRGQEATGRRIQDALQSAVLTVMHTPVHCSSRSQEH
jgi:hypothetical protein